MTEGRKLAKLHGINTTNKEYVYIATPNVGGPAGGVDVKGTSEGSRAPRPDSVGEIC